MAKKTGVAMMAIAVLLSLLVCGNVEAFASPPGGVIPAYHRSGDYEYEINEDQQTIGIVHYLGSGGKVVIPATIDGYRVNRLGGYYATDVFINNKTPLDLTIPGTVKTILSASAREAGYSQLTLGEGIEYINGGAFSSSKGLKTVSVPDSVTTLGTGAFADDPDLESVKLPAGLTELPDSLFANCSKLTGIVIPGKVKRIGSRAFADCYSLKSLTLPENVLELSEDALTFSAFQEITVLNPELMIPQFSIPFAGNCVIKGYDGSSAQLWVQQYAGSGVTFASLGAAPAKPAPVYGNITLDTMWDYYFDEGASYVFLAKTPAQTPPAASSLDPSTVSIQYAGKAAGGYLYRIRGLKEGRTTVTVSSGGINTASLNVIVRMKRVYCDTVWDFSLARTRSYTFKVTSSTGEQPVFGTGTPGVLTSKLTGHSGNSYFFTVTAVGQPGSETGVYTTLSGQKPVKQCAVKLLNKDGTAAGTAPDGSVSRICRSDTTQPIRVAKGASYTFKITAPYEQIPVFTMGSAGVFSGKLILQSGRDFYYRVTAIGQPGQTTGFYTKLPSLPAERQCVMTVA